VRSFDDRTSDSVVSTGEGRERVVGFDVNGRVEDGSSDVEEEVVHETQSCESPLAGVGRVAGDRVEDLGEEFGREV
jgi:hypothetical protein